MKHNLLTI